jgi:hypothetical protein
MKNPSRLVASILCVIVISGCSSSVPPANIPVMPTFILSPIPSTPEATPSSNAIILEINSEKVRLEFLQNGVSVPLGKNQEQWNVTLKPEPFTLMVYGNKDIISIMALKSADLLLPLKQATKPIVCPNGTSQGFYQNYLYLQDKPIEISEGDVAFFTKWNFPAQKATEVANFLQAKTGTVPFVLTSTRTYLDIKGTGVPNFTIETINGEPIQNSESIILVVFIEQNLEPNSLDWVMVKWLVFNVQFLSNQ